jgi:superfamily II DNA or RNA helicase
MLPAAEFLATLVAFGALDVRFALRPDCSGIFHDKVGIFRDPKGDVLTFVGSANETYSAWSPDANHEAFEAFRSWAGDSDAQRVRRHVAYFDSLWNDREPGVRTLTFTAASKEQLIALANPAGIDAAAARLQAHITRRGAPGGVVDDTPRPLLPHQIEAFANWVRAGHRGLLDHATGTGKTLTALAIARYWLEQNRPVLIVVPSDLLLRQWRSEAQRELQGTAPTIFVAGGGTSKAAWLQDLRAATADDPSLGRRLILATMQTASGTEFRARVAAGPHLLVIADEVHRIGSPTYSSLLKIDAGGRLGLSASPERFGDPTGTAEIRRYFGEVLHPFVSLADGIAMGRLVPYEYYVHAVRLTAPEQDRWNALTDEIALAFARLRHAVAGPIDLPDHLRLLLIQRARILKQAENKLAVAFDLTRRLYQEGTRWLLYCDSRDQVLPLLTMLHAAHLPAFEYTSLMDAPREETMERFITSGGILVAIRCLDEGVDIPSVTCAVILASSTNPREFIQRRGRVLRIAPGKYSATIHDLIVFPYDPSASPGTFVDGAFVRELQRARLFAETARNVSVTYTLDDWSRRLVQQDTHDRIADFEGEDADARP